MEDYSGIYPNLQKDGGAGRVRVSEQALRASGANFRLSSISAALSELRDEVKAL